MKDFDQGTGTTRSAFWKADLGWPDGGEEGSQAADGTW